MPSGKHDRSPAHLRPHSIGNVHIALFADLCSFIWEAGLQDWVVSHTVVTMHFIQRAAVLATTLLFASPADAASQAYTWKNAKIGGQYFQSPGVYFDDN